MRWWHLTYTLTSGGQQTNKSVLYPADLVPIHGPEWLVLGWPGRKSRNTWNGAGDSRCLLRLRYHESPQYQRQKASRVTHGHSGPDFYASSFKSAEIPPSLLCQNRVYCDYPQSTEPINFVSQQMSEVACLKRLLNSLSRYGKLTIRSEDTTFSLCWPSFCLRCLGIVLICSTLMPK